MDLNFDGRDDLILQNDEAGLIVSWFGQAGGGATPNPLGADHPVGVLAGVGDFNGDGRDDTLWRFPQGLSVADTWSDGGFYFNWTHAYVGSLASDWKVAGTGDFNRDGFDDILLRRDDGWVTNWLGNPAGPIYDFVQNGANTSLFFSPDWKIVGTGDFNGDGYDDMLIRRDDGWVTDWLGAANGQFTNNGAKTGLFFTTDWSVIGTGDFNGDGRDDLMLRRSDGWMTNWLATADGSFIDNGGNAAVFLANDWKIASIGDFNGDGRDDLMLRRDDGWLTGWLGNQNGSFENNGANFTVFVDPVWRILDPSIQGTLGGWGYW